ncbi:MAG TPA: ATP-binding protein [Blastocatellia bacterium]|nr:ATP-binding protein [Blastocatellia bacterium]
MPNGFLSRRGLFRHLLRYGLAAVSVWVALLLTQLLTPALSGAPSPLFFGAVMISAWYGGLGPGILASALSTLAIDYFFTAPLFSIVIVNDLPLLAVSSLMSVLISAQRRTRKRAEEALRRSRDELEARVERRTAQLAEMNESLEAEITERKRSGEALGQSEERYRELFENANDIVYTLDLLGNLTSVNRSGERLLGYSREELLGNSIGRIVAPEYMGVMPAMMERKIAGESLTTYEIEIISKDNRRVALEISSRMIYEQGKPVGVQGSARDITERKRAEQERARLLAREQASRVEAEEANRLKDEFLATVSHELRTPLNAILGWAELIRGGKLDSESASRALGTIVRNAKSQAQLIEDILDVSRIITGKLRLETRPVGLATIINAAVEAAQPAAYAKEITLRTSFDGSAAAVSGDPNRLQQVTWNLLSNAIKFTPSGGRVEVRLEQKDACAEIRVSDNGCGISKEFLPHVFDRFRQADSSYTREHGGLGLGLAIVRHLVEMHGGSVLVESPGEGLGATFTVKLPLKQLRDADCGTRTGDSGSLYLRVPHADAPTRNPKSSTRNPHPAILKGMRVLVVDDEADARDVISATLKQYGAEVTAIASTEEALSALTENGSGSQPDVILSDLGMPGEDGLALIAALRVTEQGTGNTIPAIALTAYARDEDRERALRAGYQLHVAKPFNPVELVEAIASVAGRNESPEDAT